MHLHENQVRRILERRIGLSYRQRKAKRGRPCTHSARTLRHIKLDVLRERFKPAVTIADSYRGSVRMMHEIGLPPRVAFRDVLTAKHEATSNSLHSGG